LSVLSLSGVFTYAGSGDDLYQSFAASVSWQPNKVLSIQVSLPHVWNSGEDKITFMEYEAHGVGDVRITAWADMTEWLFSAPPPDEGEDEGIPDEFLEDNLGGMIDAPPEPEEESAASADNRLHFRLALGVKLPTGEHDITDTASKLIPSRFQPGWGVTSPIVGVGCRQSFGKLRAVGTLLYELSGGENSEDYNHADILRLDCTAYHPIYSKYSLIGGLGYSLTWIPYDDRQNGRRVSRTHGTFHTLNVTVVCALYKGLNALLMVKIPFGPSSSGSENNLDYQYSFGLTYSF
jgi:hypothetical protein